MKITAKYVSINNDNQEEVIEKIINFLRDLPKKSGKPIYWGTYNVSLTKNSNGMIKKIKTACGINELRVICESPFNQNAPYNKRSLITRDAFDLLTSSSIKVKYFSEQNDGSATEIDRLHHAKYLICENNLLVGSFNLSHKSLHENIESIVWLEGDEIKDIYESLSTKWDDNVFEEIDPDKLIKQQPPKKEQPIKIPVTLNFKELYALILNKLHDYQKEILNTLIERNCQTDILCLPTGLGKTFIAIAWLLKQGAEKGGKSKLLIITPNRLITETIKNICVNELGIPILLDAINIKRARDFIEDQDESFSAVVFDEVHNWKPGDELNEYNLACSMLDGSRNIKILGMSATPSRHPNYDQDYFYNEFCGSKGSKTRSPLNKYTATYAIDQKWLTQPKWKIVSNSCDHLKDYTPIKGKYTERTLMREWWNTLETDVNLIKKIVHEIKINKLSKGLIYIPPVGEDLENFVEDFKAELSDYGEVLDLQSRNCCNPEAVMKKFRHSKKPIFLISINRASEGISVPEIDSLIMLRMPLSDNLAIQLIGRGLRLHPDKERLVILDAVSYKKRLELIPAWQQPEPDNKKPSNIAARKESDPRTNMFIDLIAECKYDDTDYSYDVFLKNHVNKLLIKKNFDRLVADGLSGDLKKDFGKRIDIKVYGTNLERDKKILSNLSRTERSKEILNNYIDENKEEFTYRYLRSIDEDNLSDLAKENIGRLSCEDLIDHFLKLASEVMRESLLNLVFDYDAQYIKKIKNNDEKCRSALIEYLNRSTALVD